MTPNQKAFLDMIAASEGTSTIPGSDNGYNVLVGSTPAKPLLFSSYADHPRIYNADFDSTAAGRYQLLAHWFDAYKKLLNLPDFSSASQDAIALQQIKECRALNYIEAGNLPQSISCCAHIWASLPGSDYDQHEQSLEFLQIAFVRAGGIISA